MPSKFITKEQTKDARDLAKNLDIKLHEIAVKDLYKDYERALNPFIDIEQEGAVYENLVMRIRASILMAFANKEKGLLLCTANKTELALGYCALYGDMAGALTVIGDVLKTNCYKLAYYINKKEEIIPSNILNKPCSEELRHHKDDKNLYPTTK